MCSTSDAQVSTRLRVHPERSWNTSKALAADRAAALVGQEEDSDADSHVPSNAAQLVAELLACSATTQRRPSRTVNNTDASSVTGRSVDTNLRDPLSLHFADGNSSTNECYKILH